MHEMRPRCSVFIATSLDGYISRPDGSIDWLNEANAAIPPGQDCGYGAFIKNIDILVMGRNSFEQVLSFDPWPYEGRQMIVLSSRPLEIPAHLRSSVSLSSETPSALVKRLGSEGAKHLYIDGGKTIQGFLAEGLIDEITITVIPILLGAGRRLFGEIGLEQKLSLVDSKAYAFGFVQSSYQIQTPLNREQVQ